MTATDTQEEREIEVLVRTDRANLNLFIEKLSEGIGFDDLDEELKAWWVNRY